MNAGLRADAPAAEARCDLVHGIAGVGYEDEISGVDERERKMRDPFLRPDQSQDLAGGIEIDSPSRAVVGGGGGAELDHPLVRRIMVMARLLGSALERFHDVRRRRKIGVADAEIDEVGTFFPRRALELVDSRE